MAKKGSTVLVTLQPAVSMDELLTIGAVAQRWGVEYETVRRWCAKGALAHVRVGPGGSVIRISVDEVKRHERAMTFE